MDAGVLGGWLEGGGGKLVMSKRRARRARLILRMALQASQSRPLVQCAPPEHVDDEHLKTRSLFTVEIVPQAEHTLVL